MCATIREPLRSQWTAEEVRQLRDLAAVKTPTHTIAQKLKRSIRAVQKKASEEGIALLESERK